jgi:hypothetical protein
MYREGVWGDRVVKVVQTRFTSSVLAKTLTDFQQMKSLAGKKE